MMSFATQLHRMRRYVDLDGHGDLAARVLCEHFSRNWTRLVRAVCMSHL